MYIGPLPREGIKMSKNFSMSDLKQKKKTLSPGTLS